MHLSIAHTCNTYQVVVPSQTLRNLDTPVEAVEGKKHSSKAEDDADRHQMPASAMSAKIDNIVPLNV